MFPIGVKVQTHSIAVMKYNGLVGEVIGPLRSENGLTRVLIRLELCNGEAKELLFQTKMLSLVVPANSVLQDKLCTAAMDGNIKVLRQCVKVGAHVNSPESAGFTPLCSAAQEGLSYVIKELVKLGANVNVRQKKGITPIFMAAQEGHVDAIKTLLMFGADVNMRNFNGASPVLIAAEGGHGYAIKILVSHGADVTSTTDSGCTPLLMAALNNHVEVIKLLYTLGADMNLIIMPISELGSQIKHAEALQLISTLFNNLSRGCDFCGCSSKRPKVCSECGRVRYCSVDCQVYDYKRHKEECLAHRTKKMFVV